MSVYHRFRLPRRRFYHVASVSNMAKSAPDTVYSRALQPTTVQPMKTSDDISPGPLSEHELREQWNQQADEHSQWESLDSSEQLAWAQVCAIDWNRKSALLAESEAEDETGRILRLAKIIRDVDGNHDKGAAALAEAILSHPDIRSAGLDVESMPVPSNIQQALIAAESALADIAKAQASKLLTPLEWAEGRASRALAQIRPVMRRFSVRASERPTMPVVKESLTTAPALPVDGEVEKLVEWLLDHSAYLQKMARIGAIGKTELPERLNEAAELLQRRHPAPVPLLAGEVES